MGFWGARHTAPGGPCRSRHRDHLRHAKTRRSGHHSPNDATGRTCTAEVGNDQGIEFAEG